MRNYLLFRLYGPLASWGETAVGEVRPSAAWPGRSAIVGLLSAALGIRRDEEDRLRELAAACGMGICVESSGELLRDYHTIQVPPERRGMRHLTRRDELNSEALNTMLSQRDYRSDAHYIVAIWEKADSERGLLRQLHEALQRPRFTLYLGRKSCPLALPLAPQIIQATDLRKAFDKAEFADEQLLASLPSNGEQIFVWEESIEAGMAPMHVSPRRDEPTSRKRWQFSERDEYYRSEQREAVTAREP